MKIKNAMNMGIIAVALLATIMSMLTYNALADTGTADDDEIDTGGED